MIEERRPIELTHLYVVADRRDERLLLLPTFVDGRPNPEAAALDEQSRRDAARAAARSRHAGRGGTGGGRLRRPRRTEVVERFAEESLLPAIYFVFSRAGCDDAVRDCRNAGVRLTVPEERAEIRAILERRVERLSDDDLAVLGYPALAAAMEAGIAPHHAGMVPPLREAVEECFQKALVKVVFATETLALGINMPARSVVIEQLSKFSGAGHADLTPGEYTQLTGRAGRRGIDERGLGGGAVVALPHLRRRRPPRRRALAGAAQLVSPDLQHGGQPGPALLTRGRLSPRAIELRPVPLRGAAHRAAGCRRRPAAVPRLPAGLVGDAAGRAPRRPVPRA